MEDVREVRDGRWIIADRHLRQRATLDGPVGYDRDGPAAFGVGNKLAAVGFDAVSATNKSPGRTSRESS